MLGNRRARGRWGLKKVRQSERIPTRLRCYNIHCNLKRRRKPPAHHCRAPSTQAFWRRATMVAVDHLSCCWHIKLPGATYAAVQNHQNQQNAIQNGSRGGLPVRKRYNQKTSFWVSNFWTVTKFEGKADQQISWKTYLIRRPGRESKRSCV